MIAWLKNLISSKSTPTPSNGTRQASPENCALWHDVARALDAKPKGSGK